MRSCYSIRQLAILQQQEQHISAEPTKDPWHLFRQPPPPAPLDVPPLANVPQLQQVTDALTPQPCLHPGARTSKDVANAAGSGPVAMTCAAGLAGTPQPLRDRLIGTWWPTIGSGGNLHPPHQHRKRHVAS
jgi:hypothetical protein